MNTLQPLKRLSYQLLLLLFCYLISRCAFVLINLDHFSDLGLKNFLQIAFYAIRFDISMLLTVNSVYLVFLLLPLPLWLLPWWDKMLQWVFVGVNMIALAFEISDWAYFPFTLKRSTADVLHMISRKGDFWTLLPHFITDYWYVPVALIALFILLVTVNRRIVKATPVTSRPTGRYGVHFLLQIAVLLVACGLSIILIRGGLQRTPINNSTALQVASNKFVPVVISTPFSIIHSYANNQLPELHYYSDAELKKYFDPVKQYSGKPFRKNNVVIIILESFSREFTGLGTQSYTPFLDSLMQHAYTCRKGYANALHSAEGIPAVVASIPSLMDEPFTTSYYGTNRITALPGLLRQEGYTSAFFHGGTNGTMSFDVFAANAGYDKYYGRTEYNNDKDYDGNWGIWDEPYLQYFAHMMSAMPQPFLTTVFTLSSHDPFKVPEQYKNVLPKGRLDLTQTMAYTDLSLRKFFQNAAQQDWYENTLFVFSADHACLLSDNPDTYSDMGVYSIPIVFFAPGDTMLKGYTDTIAQQIDILPSVLDYLGYGKPFFAFGNSLFRPASPRFTINELDNHYQWLMNGYLMKTKGLEANELYDFSKPIMGVNNLAYSKNDTALQVVYPYFKAFVQLYNNTLIHDKMYVPN